jgi:hypothetical protein
MNDSTSSISLASLRSLRTSGERSSARSRSIARAKPTASSARMTPRLPDSAAGLTTHGNLNWSPIASGSSSIDNRMNQGTGRPASRRQMRIISLWRATAAAAGGWPGRPSASAARAPMTVGRSPTTRMPSSGRLRADSRIDATDRSSS